MKGDVHWDIFRNVECWIMWTINLMFCIRLLRIIPDCCGLLHSLGSWKLEAARPLNRRATGDQLVWVRRAPCLPLVSVLSHPSQPGQGQKEDSPQKMMCRAYIRSPFFSKLPFFCRLDGSCRFYLGAWVVVCIGKWPAGAVASQGRAKGLQTCSHVYTHVPPKIPIPIQIPKYQ